MQNAYKQLTDRHDFWLSVAKSFNAEHPEDAVQDMYIKYITSFDKDKYVRPDGIIFTSFPYIILKNSIIDEHRKAGRRHFVEVVDDILPHEDDATEDKEWLEGVSDEIDRILKRALYRGELSWYDVWIYKIYARPEKILKKKKVSMAALGKALNDTSTMTIYSSVKRVKEYLKENLDYKKFK